MNKATNINTKIFTQHPLKGRCVYAKHEKVNVFVTSGYKSDSKPEGDQDNKTNKQTIYKC